MPKIPTAAGGPDTRCTPHPLASSRGAFDLPSIITGVVVVGILTAGVLASVFGVIPYAQDSAAKQDAAAIRTAEGVAKAKDGRFMDTAELVAAGYLSESAVSAAAPASSGDGYGFERATSARNQKAVVNVSSDGSCFVVLVKSGTGKLMYATDKISDPAELKPVTEPGCAVTGGTASLASAVGGFSPAYIPAAPSGVNGALASETSVRFAWTAVSGATGYRTEYRVNGGAWTVADANQAATSFTVGAAKLTTVEAQVQSINAAGASGYSPAVAVAVPAPASELISWSASTASTKNWRTLAASDDGQKLIAGGWNYGGVYTSKDAGKTWTQRNPNGQSFYWRSVASSADGTKLIAGEDSSGSVWTSSDSGLTWVKRVMPGGYVGVNNVASSANGTILYNAQENTAGKVYRSVDSGVSWTEVTSAGTNVWTGVSMSADGTKIVLSSRTASGILKVSTNSGATWTTRGTAGDWQHVSASKDGTVVAAARSNVGAGVYISTDAGATWAQSAAGNGTFMAVTVSGDGSRMAAASAGASGAISTSTDRGVTWTAAPNAGSGDWRALASSADGTKLFAGVNGGGIKLGVYGQ